MGVHALFESPLVDSSGAPRDGAPLGALLTAQADAAPERPSLTADGVTLSRAAFDAAANRRARWLSAKGVGQNDTVMIALRNGAAWYETAFAAWKLGATPVHVSHRLAGPEFDEIVALCQPRLIVTELPGTGHVAPAIIGGDVDASPLPARVASRWKISTSGGSTGRPKLIIDPNPSAWGPDKMGRRRPPGATIVNPAPLYHSGPFGLMLPAMAEGAHIIDMGRFDPVEYLRLTSLHRANWAYLVPTMMARIAHLPGTVRLSYNMSSLKTVLHMAAPCAPWIKRAWIDWLGPDAIWEVYGGTERIGAAVIGGREWLEHPGSVGRAAPGYHVAILDERGDPVAPGTIGEIHFRNGEKPTFEYVGAPVRGHRDLRSFGDFGWIDSEGYLFIADRRTDMVVSGGMNFYPAEIEMALEACPGVLGSAVFGLPDPDLGLALHATVQHDPDVLPADADALLAWLDRRIARPKWPRSFDFVTIPIRDEAGKLRRSAWRERRMAAFNQHSGGASQV